VQDLVGFVVKKERTPIILPLIGRIGKINE
jgi:hypothetical protein